MLQSKANIIKKYLQYAKTSGSSIFVDTSTISYEIFYEDDQLVILESKKNTTNTVGNYFNKNIIYKNIINKLKGNVKVIYTFEKSNLIEYNFNKESNKKKQIETAILSLSKVLPKGKNLYTKISKIAFPKSKVIPSRQLQTN